MKNSKTTIVTQAYSILFIMIMALGFACTSEGQNEEVTTSIHEAVFMGNVKQVQAHINAKTDLNQKDQYGSTPLAVAITFDKPQVAKLLIDGGADVNAKGGDGSTALHTAAFYGRVEIVEEILQNGADIDVRNNYGSTALESVQAPFEDVKGIYDQLGRDLGPLGLKFDYDKLKSARPKIASMIEAAK